MKITEAVEMIKGERAAIADEIAAALRRKTKIAAEIARLRAMPISLEDWGQYLKAEIAAQGQGWMGSFPGDLLARGTFKTPSNERGWIDFEREDGSFCNLPGESFGSYGDGTALRALCALFPGQVHQALMERIKGRIGERWGNIDLPTVAERRAEIVRLEQEDERLDERQTQLSGRLAELA